MKYGKYARLSEQHPFLKTLLWEMCSPHAPRSTRNLKDFVSERVDFIAYRPWNTLDLNAGNMGHIGEQIPHAYAHQHFWQGTHYVVYFWIGNEELPRQRSVSNPEWDKDGLYTIEAVINHLKDWYTKCFDPNKDPIRWEAVVRRSSSGGVVVGRSKIEVFPFPPNFK